MSDQTFVVRTDLDKTYLRTEFDRAKDLLRTALERPDRKQSVPGAAALMRELGRSSASIHILSGSPRQMRLRLEAKLRLDGVRFDRLTLKPNLNNLLRLRFRALREQLGYKLPELLAARLDVQREVEARQRARSPTEILIGDDVEADAFVYSLYADVCAGHLDRAELKSVLKAGEIYADQRRRTLGAAAQLEPADCVTRILIHLDRQTPPSQFAEFGPRLVPFYNYFQAALMLTADGLLSGQAMLRIAADLLREHRFEPEALVRSYADLLRRCQRQLGVGARVESAWTAHEQNGTLHQLCEDLRSLDASLPRVPAETPLSPNLDLDFYVNQAARHRGGRNRHAPRTW